MFIGLYTENDTFSRSKWYLKKQIRYKATEVVEYPQLMKLDDECLGEFVILFPLFCVCLKKKQQTKIKKADPYCWQELG